MQVVTLLAKVVEHLVTGETMQMTTTSEQRLKYVLYLKLFFGSPFAVMLYLDGLT